MLIGAKELGQAAAVQFGIGIDMVFTVHEVADTTEELLFGCEVFLGFSLQQFDGLSLFAFALFYLLHQSAVFLKEHLIISI